MLSVLHVRRFCIVPYEKIGIVKTDAVIRIPYFSALFALRYMGSNKAGAIISLIKDLDTCFAVGIVYPSNRKRGRRLTYVWRSRALWVQCNIEEVKVFESLRELRVDPDLDAPAPPPPPSSSRRSNPSDVVLRAPL